MWTLVGLWASLVLLATYAFLRGLSTLKSLRNVYYYKAFDLPCTATDHVTPRIWSNFQRLLHSWACLSYRDPQFQLPPDLHCLLFLEYACFLLVCDHAAELIQPCEEGFSGVEAAVAAGVAMTLAVGVDMSVERVFVKSLNQGNKGQGEEYVMSGEQEGRTVNTVPIEADFSVLIQSPSSLLKSTVQRPLPGEYRPSEPVPLPPPSAAPDLLLLLLLMFLAGCSLWGIYVSPLVQVQAIWIHWGIGLALDLPFRIVLALLFWVFGGLTDPCKGYKRLGYQLRWKDLGKHRCAPRKAEVSAEDNQEVQDIPEEALYPSSVGETQQQSLSALSHTLNSASFLSEIQLFQEEDVPTTELLSHIPSLPIKEEVIPTTELLSPIPSLPSQEEVISTTELPPHIPSLPITSREALFPPTNPLSIPTDREEICPTPFRFISTPEATTTPPSFDEFPIPPNPDRFSDIEGSVADFEEPQVPVSPTLDLRRPRRSASLMDALYGKSGLFGRGGPILTLRQSRTRSPKRPPRSRPLASILSENEEETKPKNRPDSPEAAESTRYQTPASPIIAKIPPRLADMSPRPPRTQVFKSGSPLPPIVPDAEVYLRPDSPEELQEQVAFREAVRQSKSQPRLRSRSRIKPRLPVDDYDSPYQEILWRRLPGEERRGRVLPMKQRGQPWH